MYRFAFVSNQEITDPEFERWQRAIQEGNMSVPTTDDVTRKIRDLAKARQYRMTEKDIDAVGVQWDV